jgi:hypothetical protein
VNIGISPLRTCSEVLYRDVSPMSECGVDKLIRSVVSYGHVNKALDSHTNEQRDGWMDGWIHRQTDRQVSRKVGG